MFVCYVVLVCPTSNTGFQSLYGRGAASVPVTKPYMSPIIIVLLDQQWQAFKTTVTII